MVTETAVHPPIDDTGIDLDKKTLLEMYWQMVRARRTDERTWVLHRQGKIAFHISGIGHEGNPGRARPMRCGVGMTTCTCTTAIWRSRLALGYTPREFYLAVFGKAGEPTSGARQMPSHFSSRAARDALVVQPGSDPGSAGGRGGVGLQAEG